MPLCTLRSAVSGDAEFLFGVYASTRSEEMAITGWTTEQQQVFLRSQFAAQDRHYRAFHPAACFDIVQAQGKDAGRLYVDRSAAQLHVLDIALLPEYRGLGLGRALMRGLLVEAAAGCGKVVLHVERHNPALHLYRRMGFTEVADQGFHIEMQWLAPQASPPAQARAACAAA